MPSLPTNEVSIFSEFKTVVEMINAQFEELKAFATSVCRAQAQVEAARKEVDAMLAIVTPEVIPILVKQVSQVLNSYS